MNKGCFIILFIIIWGFRPCYAQSAYDLESDTLSLKLYEEQRWEDLYQLVKVAQQNEVDFYYLAIRGAMASFHTGRYFQANAYFEQAEAYKRGNDYIREFHYLSALYAQLPLRIEQTYQALSDEAKKRYMAPKYKSLQYLGVASGYNYNADYKRLKSFESQGVYSDRILFEKLNFLDLYSGHQFSPHWSLHQSIERLSINKVQDAYTQNASTGAMDTHQQDITTQQWSYNLNLWYNINDQVFVYPFFTLLSYKTNYLHISYDEDTYVYSPSNKRINEEHYLYGLGLKVRQSRLNWEFSGSRMHTNRGNYYQSTLSAQLLPFPGQKHYLSATWHSINRISTSDENFNHHVLSLKLGINIKKVWTECSYSTGNHQFLVTNYGAAVYNTYETIKSISACNVSFPIYEKLWLSLNYKYLNYHSTSYFADLTSGLYKENFNHNNHSIAGGLTWYF